MKKVNILLVLHNHQPCDNFGWVFEDAYKKSYEPFIAVLEKYPRVKVAMHYSGSLLEWLHKFKPEFISRIKSLVKKRQITLLTGGFYEPIFPIIPDRDKIAQVKLLTDFIRNRFECNPKGLWITERVWEEGLSDLFLSLGLEYTIVDENHLKRAGVSREKIHGYFELRNGFKVFAASKLLRYMIPFARIDEISEHFKKLSEKLKETFVIFADDGEKFGFWPHTYRWVYKKRWLEKFFEYLSDEETILESVAPEEAFDRFKPSGKVDIPPSSYSEMMEWSKGDFNNFFKIYPEANIMRNRMLYVSKEIEKAEASPNPTTTRQRSLFQEAKKELYKAQSGCPYWHGVFGGLYLNHLRSGVYKHLINAQNALERLSKPEIVHLKMYDLDNDASDEIIIGNRFLDLYIKPGRSGSIFALDNKRKSYNMINIITRRPEAYHSKLVRRHKNNFKNIKRDLEKGKAIDIHNILGIRGRNLEKFLIYDDTKKDSVIDYFLAGKFSLKDFSKGKREKLIKLSKNHYNVNKIIDKNYISFILEKTEDIELEKEVFCVYIKKELILSNSSEFYIEYTLKNLSRKKLFTTFATEYNWSFMNKYFLKNRDFRNIDSFLLKDEWSDIEIKYRFSESVRLWSIPIYTLNETESGLDKTYQYLSLLIQTPISLACEEDIKLSSTITIE